MRSLPWTKFQDFYLRLGFLKLLVAVLSPQRRSEMNELIVRKLESPSFNPASQYPALWGRVSKYFPDQDRINSREDASKIKQGKIAIVADALIVDGNCQSFLSAITKKTAYKILDWGRNVEFIGQGNQISERGILLRQLSDEPSLEKFIQGDVEAWNPFVLSERERLLFLYHLAEIDGVILELTKDLGSLPEGTVVESKDAALMTSMALIRVLSSAKNSVPQKDILKFRTACDLAITIAGEVGHSDLASQLIGSPRVKPPAPIRPKALRQLSKNGEPLRKANKNADHQTIPRFEQLVDLGFLAKSDQPSDFSDVSAPRKKWRYKTTAKCERWAQELAQYSGKKPFLWNGFAKACLAMSDNKVVAPEIASIELVAEYLQRAYEIVRRRAGYDPLDSVALMGMIMAIADGLHIEMADFHHLMLAIKQHSLLPNHAYFASGNDVDQMFILLKPGFVDQVKMNASEIALKSGLRA